MSLNQHSISKALPVEQLQCYARKDILPASRGDRAMSAWVGKGCEWRGILRAQACARRDDRRRTESGFQEDIHS